MVSRLALALLAVATVSVVVEARVFHDGSFSTGRQLLQVNNCPAGCDIAGDGCVRDSTEGGYRCIKCMTGLLVNNDDGQCYCPAGKYASVADTCTDCPKGSYCEGGLYVAAEIPNKVNCSTWNTGLDTIGRRSVSKKACVNKPGYKYILNGTDPSAAQCDANTYGPGLRKQRECVPCAPGFTSDAGSDAAGDCVVPAGYFLKSPGQVAPCPKGEWKEGTTAVTACTPCAIGVTTQSEASTSEAACAVVLPSYYPFNFTSNFVKETKKCPQKHWCPGGIPMSEFNPSTPTPSASNLVYLCTNGTWTQNLGASNEDECLTPPGYKTSNGTTEKCADGAYRAEWMPASVADSCNVCGVNIKSEETDQIIEYNIVSGAANTVTVATTSGSCYIVAGQGMFFSPASGLFRAVDCETNNYGVANKTTGLAAYPCRACPAGMQTNISLPNSNAYKAANGFYDPKACVTKVGFGYNGRVASQCRPDSYNAAGNYATCTQCPTGFTTDGTAATQAVDTDCRLAEGYGVANGAVGLCPVGTYRTGLGPEQASGNRLNQTCTDCSAGTTTSRPGARGQTDCNLCLPGWGGAANCTTQCGGTDATYGPAGRSPEDSSSACLVCPTMTVGFSFDVSGDNDAFTPDPVAREGAESAADCLAEFAQIEDVAWYLGGDATMTAVSGANNFSACAAACTDADDCQYITFNYTADDGAKCAKRDLVEGVSGEVLAFKAVLSGDVAASSVTGKVLVSGSYTFWNDAGTGVGTPISGGSTDSTTACLAACDIDASCAAVQMTGVTADTAAGITGCTLVAGDTTIAQFVRSATRAVVTKLAVSAAAPLAGP